jgi:tRNA pseudouridine55 synthase
MKNLKLVNKKTGETPWQAIIRFKKNNPRFLNDKISYAGRLDPMASGVLLLLVNQANKKRRLYEKLDKEYVFEVLFAVSTDSDDILGLITDSKDQAGINKTEVKNILQLIKQKQFQYPPAYSAVRLRGKPLYYWARKNKLGDMKIKKRKIKIYNISLLSIYSISKIKLENYIAEKISLVSGNFRQKKISASWKNYFKTTPLQSFKVAKIKTRCSSGTYIRTICKDIGRHLNLPSLALTIKRTKIFLS